jgi:hypothetical protein
LLGEQLSEVKEHQLNSWAGPIDPELLHLFNARLVHLNGARNVTLPFFRVCQDNIGTDNGRIGLLNFLYFRKDVLESSRILLLQCGKRV